MHIRTQLVIIRKRFRIYKIEYWNSNLILKHLVTPLVVYWLDLISAVKNINECAFTYTLIWYAVYGKVINLIEILPKNYYNTSWIDIFRFIFAINDIQYSWRYVLTEINCSTYIHIMSYLTRYFLRKKQRWKVHPESCTSTVFLVICRVTVAFLRIYKISHIYFLINLMTAIYQTLP